jgi:hypothetical protein
LTDVLFRGGRVFAPSGPDAPAAGPFEGAVLVRGGRIAAVGPEEDVVRRAREAGASRTETVDLAGGLLVPGFVDAHVHPVHAGLDRAACDLSEAGDLAGYQERVRAYAAAHPDREWITGGGWDMSAFPGGLPHRSHLDFVGRPVYLVQSDLHAAWVNGRALELAGIDRNTPDPPDGRIERDPDGTPSGVLHEGAMDLVGRLTPRPTERDLIDALLEAQRYLFSLGVTGWQDAIVGPYAGVDDQLPAYLSAAGSGALRAKVVGALWWDRSRGAEQIEELKERRASAEGLPAFRATSVKIMQDGIPENFTAAVLEPYCGRGGERGLSYVDPVLLKEYVAALDREGFQIHFHAIGERAVREVLDALENTSPANRHHIAHLQIVEPSDVPRLAALGVTANLQALWACHDPEMVELCIPHLGEERAAWQYPFADLVRHGTRLAAGSDWPVTSADPFQAMHVAVNRTLPPDDPDYATHPAAATPFLPHQALDLATIMTAYTAGSAWLNRSAAGVIAEGAPADLAVLDRDPFRLPPSEIYATKVVMTFVDGECVHQ